MTTSDQAPPVARSDDDVLRSDAPGSDRVDAFSRSTPDPVVDDLARAIDPPGRAQRFVAWPGHVVRSLAGWSPEAWVSAIVVGACMVFVFLQLGPNNIFSDTTPAGGDMGAHVWGPAFMRDHLLPSFRLTGWSPDWYAGFPAYQFYMVLPSLAIALLSFVIPYGIAFKLIAVSGLVSLPVCAWAFGKLTRLPFPGPALFAVGATAFLFDRSFSILGGNIASTMAGEFAFSISLSFALLFLGVVGRGMENGKHRAWAAVLLALTGLCHLIPFLFVVGAAVVWFIVSLARRSGMRTRLWWLLGAGPVGAALTGFWLVPFYLQHGYMNDMGWEKKTNFLDLLFRRETLDSGLVDSPRIEWVLLLALLGVVMSIAWKRRVGGFLILTAMGVAITFWLIPQTRLWNARLLPFFYLTLYLLAALGIAELGRTIATLLARDPGRPVRLVTIGTAVAAWVVVITSLAMPLRAMPGGSVQPDGSYQWAFLSTTESSFVSSWARWNFTGYENKPAYPEYQAIVSTMAGLGQTQGCGRAMWEHEEQHDRYGTPMALMLLPFWTDGCIGSMEGLFFESSSTTPYHFLMQDELSTGPSNAQRDLPYSPGAPSQAEFDIGVQHMQLLGVGYYMAISDPMIEKGRANPGLEEVATSGPWVVFTVSGSETVVALDNQPAVVAGVHPARDWLETMVPWYEDPQQWSVFLADDGPDDWQRIEPGTTPAEVSTPPVAVTDIETGTDTISFRVSQPGTPVLVKTSYFPNWKVDGAAGPWRISPNLMVVVPTTNEVSMSYGMTTIDWLGWALSALGLVGLVLLIRAGPLAMAAPRPWRRPREPDDETGGEADDEAGVPATDFDPVAAVLGGVVTPTEPVPYAPPVTDPTSGPPPER